MSSSTDFDLDLDAARRESAQPEGINVTYKGEQFTLPAELPADVFDPFLSREFDLVGLLKPILEEQESKKAEGGENADDSLTDTILKVLFGRPTLPADVLDAIHASFRLLFGEEDYARFRALRPSFADYGRLVKGLINRYGVSLGEAFASPASSETGGATPKETSPSTADSTPAKSGAAAKRAKAS